jgi:hypothetical protein
MISKTYLGFKGSFYIGGLLRKSSLLLLTILFLTQQLLAQTTTVNYSYDGSNFCNPERGFYKYSDNSSSLSASTLSGFRALGYTLVYRIYYINNSGSLSASFLSQFDTDMQTIRSSGLKCVLRFAYTSSDANDAPISTVLSHLDQLQPHFQSNYDVIAVLQMGFIGRWGEGYYTNNFGDQGSISTTDWNNRTSVLLKELSAMPIDRMVCIRYPWHKKTLLSRTSTITAAEAYTGSNWARVGFHDDAFMAASDDWGTFPSGASDRAFLAAESQYLATGGEAESGDQTVNGCSNTTTQVTNFHISFLDADYNLNTINKWQSEGCFSSIQNKMGYRFYLNNGTYTTQVQPGGTFNLNINLTNEGYAAPFNPRLVEVVLKNTADGKICKAQLNVNPRFWLPGSVNVNQNVGIPSNYPPGNYKVYLNLPDPVSTLYGNPNYSIRMANTGMWDGTTGYNDLGFTLVISNSASTSTYSGSQWFNTTCYGSLPVQFTSFNGQLIGPSATITWTTVNEKSNEYFIVQRSYDGVSFESIGKVYATNNSQKSATYTYTDANVGAKIVYYRLVQVDSNGSSQNSTIIKLSGNYENDVFLFPNPADESVSVKIQSAVDTDYQIQMYNSIGKLIMSLDGKTMNGFDDKKINLSSVESGIYFINIVDSNNNSWYKKLVKN